MRFCDHDFHVLARDFNPVIHAMVGCAYCGEVRYIYADGHVEIYAAIEGAVKNHARDGNTKPKDS